jgi:multidrug transporter EmrE-like cation transporter
MKLLVSVVALKDKQHVIGSMGFVLILIGAIIVTVGDIVLKKWVMTNSFFLYFLGIFFYLIGASFLALSYKYKNIAVASVIFIMLNIFILSLVSWLYFKEPLSQLQIIGIILGLSSVVILEVA